MSSPNPEISRFDLLALPNARILPVESVAAIEGYLRQGGDLLALGLPGWEDPRFRICGHWLSRQAYEAGLLEQRTENALLDLTQDDPTRWSFCLTNSVPTFKSGGETHTLTGVI